MSDNAKCKTHKPSRSDSWHITWHRVCLKCGDILDI